MHAVIQLQTCIPGERGAQAAIVTTNKVDSTHFFKFRFDVSVYVLRLHLCQFITNERNGGVGKSLQWWVAMVVVAVAMVTVVITVVIMVVLVVVVASEKCCCSSAWLWLKVF